MPPRVPRLPPNVLRLIHDKADARTKARMQVATRDVPKSPVGPFYRGNYPELWNVDRALKRLQYKHGMKTTVWMVLPFNILVGEFVRRCKERYKALRARGIATATWAQFMQARTFFQPDPNWMYSVYGSEAVEAQGGPRRFSFEFKQGWFQEGVEDEIVEVLMKSPVKPLDPERPRKIEERMDAVLLFGKMILELTTARLTRKQRRSQDLGLTRIEKNSRRLQHQFAGILHSNNVELGVPPEPHWRATVKARAAQRRIAARAARRLAAGRPS